MLKKVAAIILTCLFSLMLIGDLTRDAPSGSGPSFRTGQLIGFAFVLVGLSLSVRWVVVLFGEKRT